MVDSQHAVMLYDAIPFASHGVDWGVVVMQPDNTTIFEHNGDAPFQAHELNQLVIAAGHMALGSAPDTPFNLKVSDWHTGERDRGVLQYAEPGIELTIGIASRLMLSLGDYAAARALVRLAGGPEAIHEAVGTLPIADRLTVSRLSSQNGPPNEQTRYLYGKTTPRESALLFNYVLGDPQHAQALSDSVWSALRREVDRRHSIPHPLEELAYQGKSGYTVTAEDIAAALATAPVRGASDHANKYTFVSRGQNHDMHDMYDVARIGGGPHFTAGLTVAALGNQVERSPASDRGWWMGDTQAAIGMVVRRIVLTSA